METVSSIFILIGTLLPLLGTGLTIILANIYDGKIRWISLFLIPALTMVICWVWADAIWQNGNMLAAALFFIYMISLVIYYPLLIISAVIILRTTNQAKQSNHG
jgi:hypothetical protein